MDAICVNASFADLNWMLLSNGMTETGALSSIKLLLSLYD
jgi:hypothetical protein